MAFGLRELKAQHPDLWAIKPFRQWFAERPEAIRRVILVCPGDRPYRLLPNTDFPVWIHSYDEEMDGTVTLKVDVDSWLFPRRVFGIKPEDLVPWEGPFPPNPLEPEPR